MQCSLSALLTSILAYVLFASAPINAQNYVKIGDGCEGVAGIPSITALGDPVLGETFSVELGNVDSMGIAAGLSGLSNSQWSGLALPADLGMALGMYGLDPMGMQMDPCILYTDVRRVANLTITGGTAVWNLNMPPLSLEWIGRKFYQQAFVIDSNVGGLPAVLSDAYEGTMIAPPPNLDFEAPTGIAADGNRALVCDRLRSLVFAVDLSTGDRSIFSGGLVGSGPPFDDPYGIVIDGSRALVANRPTPGIGGNPAVIAVDLVTGNRTVVSDLSTGMGPGWGNLAGIAIDGSRAIVTDVTPAAVFSMDLLTGDRAILSDNNVGTGPELLGVNFPSLSISGGRAYTLGQISVPNQSPTPAVLAVDLMTGNRIDVSSRVTGSGPNMFLGTGVLVEGSRVLATMGSLGLIYSVDIATGVRTVFSGLANATVGTAQVGNGLGFDFPIAMALDGTRVLVTDQTTPGVWTVELATGDRAILSDNN